MIKLTVIIPVFNEENTIKNIVNKILKLKNSVFQIIIVDDCSTDKTKKKIKSLNSKKILKIYKNNNEGKGSAIQTALKFVKGTHVIIQDADLEYFPSDYTKFINFFKKNYKEKILYGSRFKKKNYFPNRIFYYGNIFMTKISNYLNNQKISDAHTCYKMYKTSILKKFKLKENNFGFCAEVNTKASLSNIKIHEISIKYNGRSFDKGKKISILDGLKSIFVIVKLRLFKK